MSLKQQSAWWILPLTVKSVSDIIMLFWTYFHSQFHHKYSLLSVNTLLWCIHYPVGRIVLDWLPTDQYTCIFTKSSIVSLSVCPSARPKIECEFGLAVLVMPKLTWHIDHRKPGMISVIKILAFHSIYNCNMFKAHRHTRIRYVQYCSYACKSGLNFRCQFFGYIFWVYG